MSKSSAHFHDTNYLALQTPTLVYLSAIRNNSTASMTTVTVGSIVFVTANTGVANPVAIPTTHPKQDNGFVFISFHSFLILAINYLAFILSHLFLCKRRPTQHNILCTTKLQVIIMCDHMVSTAILLRRAILPFSQAVETQVAVIIQYWSWFKVIHPNDTHIGRFLYAYR